MKTIIASILPLLFVVHAYAVPQAGISTGEIRGRVTDPAGAVIPSVSIVLKSRNTGVETSVVSDEIGNYRALLLRPDTYEVDAKLTGFVTSKKIVELTVG